MISKKTFIAIVTFPAIQDTSRSFAIQYDRSMNKTVGFFQQQPFKSMHEKYPERLKKIILVSGDTTIDELGLSTSDKKRLQEEVSVIFHVAANVKFNLSLKDAVKINTLGTMRVLKLAKQVGHTPNPSSNPFPQRNKHNLSLVFHANLYSAEMHVITYTKFVQFLIENKLA